MILERFGHWQLAIFVLISLFDILAAFAVLLPVFAGKILIWRAVVINNWKYFLTSLISYFTHKGGIPSDKDAHLENVHHFVFLGIHTISEKIYYWECYFSIERSVPSQPYTVRRINKKKVYLELFLQWTGPVQYNRSAPNFCGWHPLFWEILDPPLASSDGITSVCYSYLEVLIHKYITDWIHKITSYYKFPSKTPLCRQTVGNDDYLLASDRQGAMTSTHHINFK